MTLRDAALRYATSGWRVFPVSRSKVPLVADWPNVATTDLAQVRAWWDAWPKASIGYATGELVAIDVDGAQGIETRRETEAQGLEWPVTLTAFTGRAGGGIHAYYRVPEFEPIRNCAGLRGGRGIGPGIDVRGVGGFTVLPPSPHKSGRAYEWLIRCEPATVPQWMVERLRTPAPAPRRPLPRRDGDLTRYAAAALDAEVEAVETAPMGTLNDTLNRAAYSLGRLVPTISEDTIREALLAAALANGHPERGARATIRSGLNAGMARR